MSAKQEAPGSDELSFDTLMNRLDGIVGELEAGELPLERALTIFEEGIKLARAGSQRLDAAEKKIEVLLAENEVDVRALEGEDKERADADS